MKQGFTQLNVEHCTYYCRHNSGVVFATLHVDDFTVAASIIEEERRFEELSTEWKISRDNAHFIVRWVICRDRQKHTAYLSQKVLIDKILSEFNCKDANLVRTPLTPNTRLTK
jgi:hypothetical protein